MSYMFVGTQNLKGVIFTVPEADELSPKTAGRCTSLPGDRSWGLLPA